MEKTINTKQILSSALTAFILIAGNFIEGFGESLVALFLLITKGTAEALMSLMSFIWQKSGRARENIMNLLTYSAILIISPITKLIVRFSYLAQDVKTANSQKGASSAVGTFFSGLRTIIFGKNGIMISLFNIAAPIVSILFLMAIINYNQQTGLAVKLEIDDELYGYIENEQIFLEAEKYVDSRLNYLGSSKQINVTPDFAIEKAGYSELLSPIQVADMILSNSNINVQQAFGVYMNGSLVGAVTDNSGIKAALEGILSKYRTDTPDEEVKFVQEIDCEQGGIYTEESIVDPQIIINQITSLKQQAQYYTVQEGDSHSLICDKIDMTMTEVESLNPGFSQMPLRAGDKIQYSVDVAFLDVSITRTEVYNTYVNYETTYENDNGMYIGTTRVLRNGERGVNRITARVAKVNGVEKERKIISTQKMSDPREEIIARGTKPAPSGTYSAGQASFGKFIWPVNPGGPAYVSELTYWDGGYYGHKGIDFAGPYGTPIYAGDGGVVVWSGWYYDYGRTVMIDHPNGLRTLYAHCSQLLVSVGENVSQGQQIALMGSTGYSSGTHVHFEVIQGNTKYNPRNFLDGI